MLSPRESGMLQPLHTVRKIGEQHHAASLEEQTQNTIDASASFSVRAARLRKCQQRTERSNFGLSPRIHLDPGFNVAFTRGLQSAPEFPG